MSTKRVIPLDMLRPEIAALIRADHPDMTDATRIDMDMVHRYRSRHVAALLADSEGKLSDLNAEIARSFADRAPITDDTETEFSGTRSFGDRAADAIASFGGSWSFILLFAAFLAIWMTWNRVQASGAFDPYPFILLNLILSTLAAVQAPIIMMSQRRQEEKDRLRARNDYQVNLKAELEIRALHDKLDNLIAREWQWLDEARATQQDLNNTGASGDPSPAPRPSTPPSR